MEQFYWAALGAAKGIDTARMLALVRAFGSAQNLYEAEEADILATGIVAPECASRFVEHNKRNRKLPEMLREQCERLCISVVPVVSSLYPERLKQILHPPLVLYVKGTLPDCRYSMGMVGSRMADAYGKKAATCFGKALAEAGVIIVSGGAAGIDTAAARPWRYWAAVWISCIPIQTQNCLRPLRRMGRLCPSIRPERIRNRIVSRSGTGSSAASARALCWCRQQSGAER